MDILRLCGISRLMNFGGSRARFVRMHTAWVILCPFHVVSNHDGTIVGHIKPPWPVAK